MTTIALIKSIVAIAAICLFSYGLYLVFRMYFFYDTRLLGPFALTASIFFVLVLGMFIYNREGKYLFYIITCFILAWALWNTINYIRDDFGKKEVTFVTQLRPGDYNSGGMGPGIHFPTATVIAQSNGQKYTFITHDPKLKEIYEADFHRYVTESSEGVKYFLPGTFRITVLPYERLIIKAEVQSEK